MLDKYSCNGEWFDVSPEMAMCAATGAAAKLGHPMRPIDEQMATKVLQIAANGGLPPATQESPAYTAVAAFGMMIYYIFLGMIGFIIMVVAIPDLPSWFSIAAPIGIALFSFALGFWRLLK